MKRYPKYKESGVEWIGEIPSHWRGSFYKHEISILSGFPFKSELFDSSEGFPILRIRDITSGKIETFYKGEYDPAYIIKKGDVVIGMDGDYNIRLWDNDDILLNQRCCRVFPDSELLLKYIYYTLPFDLKVINDLTYYTTVKHLSVEEIKNIRCAIPPIEEQKAIVSFLDTKTSQIDALISNSEKKIELLKEKRTALINHVVTKGLDPNMKMKDSGVEWIGEMPENCTLTRIGFLCDLLTGNPWPSDLFNHDIGIKIVRGENVSEGFLRWGDRTRYWNHEIVKGDLYYLQDGDIVVSMDGSKVGKNYVRISELDLPLLLHQRMCRIRVSTKLNSRYLEYCIGSDLFQYHINISKTDPLIPHITQKDIYDYFIVLPPNQIQNEIVKYLDHHTSEIDKEISVEERRIELLKEYRQSLISEVVTGKVNILDYAN